MAISVARIAELAFNGVSNGISGVVHSATLTQKTAGTYNASTGVRAATTAPITGRAIEDAVKPVRDIFPAYERGPSDKLVLLEGMTSAPVENDTLAYSDRSLTIMAVADIAGGGGLYYVMAR